MAQDPALQGRKAERARRRPAASPKTNTGAARRAASRRGAGSRLGAALAALALAVCTIAAAAPARAAEYAAYVMDARTGETLHASNADTRLHPASLTKMMTLYLTIEAVKEGRLGLDQKVRVSRKAARQVPSKIGLREGSYVTIRHLIRAAAIKSANDAAMALAEAVGGSEDAFARMMTEKAREFGMRNTTFRNPHGLTQNGHLSTARDMAMLGRRLFFDHPEYYNLFSRKSAVAMGKTIRNTNRRLLSSYRGADGIKTGYTRAAGFNLVASAQRGDKHVITAVFGGRSSRSRNAEVARLLDLGFDRSPAHARVVPPRNAGLIAQAPLPVFREIDEEAQSVVADIARAIGPAAANAAVSRGASTVPLAEVPLATARPEDAGVSTAWLEPGRVVRPRREAPRRAERPTSRPRAASVGVAMAVEFPTPRPR